MGSLCIMNILQNSSKSGYTNQDPAVSSMISYIVTSGILVTFFLIIMLSINSLLVQGPAEYLTKNAFIDIGNGISTRIVDVYSIAPTGSLNPTSFSYIESRIDVPKKVLGRDYSISITNYGKYGTNTTISRDNIVVDISMAGVSLSKQIEYSSISSTSIRNIRYQSSGF